jgi:NADPH:quinone reductase-like Zn-dependent oxidoreductase
MTNPKPTTMKALYFETTGKPLDVLRLDDVAIPSPGTGQVRVRVHALRSQPCGLGGVRGLPARSLLQEESGSMSPEPWTHLARG